MSDDPTRYALPRKIGIAQLACSDAALEAKKGNGNDGQRLLLTTALALVTMAEDAQAVQDLCAERIGIELLEYLRR